MGKKKKPSRTYMLAPYLPMEIVDEVMERNHNRCCSCNKEIERNQLQLCFKDNPKKDEKITSDKLKSLCKKCAKKIGRPYVDPNIEHKPKKVKTYADKLRRESPSQLRRQIFPYEMRKQILKNTYGICACCGKPLTTKTMTIEHIIPIAKNGENTIENLTALCYDCNQIKGNKLYLAEGFYTALVNKPRFAEIHKYTIEWFKQIKDTFDLIGNPMISPDFNFFHVPFGLIHNTKKFKYTTQFLYQYSYVHHSQYRMIKHLTGKSCSELSDEVNKLNGTTGKHVAFYTLTKISTKKIINVIAVLYDMDNYRITMHTPWSDIANDTTNAIFTYKLAHNISTILTDIADKPIDEVIIKHHDTKVVEQLVHCTFRTQIWYGCEAIDCKPGTTIFNTIKLFRYIEDSNDEKFMRPSDKKRLENPAYSISIDELDIKTNIKNILHNRNIKNLNDLTRLTENDLLKIKSIGPKSVEQIELALETYNLILKRKE